MRTRIIRLIVTIGMLGVIHFTKAQTTFVSSYIEQTKVGSKVGTQLGFETRHGYEIGAFYQKEADIIVTEENKPRFYEKEFKGMFFAGNIIEGRKIKVKLNVRTGVTNKINFTITPSVMGSYQLGKSARLLCGIGMRTLRPTLRLGMRFNIAG